MSQVTRRILWWGRFGNYGPDYPRNRTIIQCLKSMGWDVVAYQPRISVLAHFEAAMHSFEDISAVWVPCFRQRDVVAAAKWAKRKGVPLVFDPLISAYDKRVNERKKFPVESRAAKKVLHWEQGIFSMADVIVADTLCHKEYFFEVLNYPRDKIVVLPVSAEESLFYPEQTSVATPPEVLFFGTFIGLQGTKYIAESLRYYQGPPICLTMLGEGPERAEVEQIASDNLNKNIVVKFEDWIPFANLPGRIRRSQVCLGVFGVGEKSFRVIPNKVYQALACDKPVVTMRGDAYPDMPENGAGGIYWSEAGSPQDLAVQLELAVDDHANGLSGQGKARLLYDTYFSNLIIRKRLEKMLP